MTRVGHFFIVLTASDEEFARKCCGGADFWQDEGIRFDRGGVMKQLLVLLGFGLALAPTGVALADPPAYYVGAGVRSGFNDDFAGVINSKAELLELGEELSLSARPAVIIGDDFELRLPLSIEGEIYESVYPYAGVGIAFNQDGSSEVDPMITGGVDFAVAERVYVGATGNAIFRNNDTDFELIGTVNYAF